MAPEELDYEVPDKVAPLDLIPLVRGTIQGVEGVQTGSETQTIATRDDAIHITNVRGRRRE